jgi:hypothetical protein
MPEVLVSTDSITVVGPPNIVEVLVDIGPQGFRGNRFIVGSGDPNASTSSGVLFGNNLILNDMYINTTPGADYGYLYQYVRQPGGIQWVQVLDMNPVIYSETHLTTYTAGAAQISIPISNIVTTSGTPLTAENFNIQYSIAHSNPLASSMSIPALAGSGTNLVINFNAVEYDDDSGPAEWIPLDGTVTTHLFISIVAGIDES